MVPRSGLRMASRGGVMYVLGGVGKDGQPASPAPLGSEMFPFAQKACLDFLGNKEQAMPPMPQCPNAPLPQCPTAPMPKGPNAPTVPMP